jgi:hypothetical protein
MTEMQLKRTGPWGEEYSSFRKDDFWGNLEVVETHYHGDPFRYRRSEVLTLPDGQRIALREDSVKKNTMPEFDPAIMRLLLKFEENQKPFK